MKSNIAEEIDEEYRLRKASQISLINILKNIVINAKISNQTYVMWLSDLTAEQIV